MLVSAVPQPCMSSSGKSHETSGECHTTARQSCKATHGRGYCKILPALFSAPNILGHVICMVSIPDGNRSTPSLFVPRRCLMGSGLAEMRQGWSLVAGMHFVPTYSGSRMPAATHCLPCGSPFHSQTLPAQGLLQAALLQVLAEHVTLAGVTEPSPCRCGED